MGSICTLDCMRWNAIPNVHLSFSMRSELDGSGSGPATPTMTVLEMSDTSPGMGMWQSVSSFGSSSHSSTPQAGAKENICSVYF
jgi:hypothetical protein